MFRQIDNSSLAELFFEDVSFTGNNTKNEMNSSFVFFPDILSKGYYFSLMTLYLLGIIGNITSIAVFRRNSFNSTSTSMSYQFLGLFQVLLIIGWAATITIDYWHITLSKTTCLIDMYFINVLLLLTNWTLVFITTERLTSICFPYQVRTVWTKRRTLKIFIIGSGITLLSISSIFIVDTKLDRVGVYVCFPHFENHNLEIVRYWLEFCFMHTLPCVLLVVGNFVIAVSLGRNRRKLYKYDDTAEAGHANDTHSVKTDIPKRCKNTSGREGTRTRQNNEPELKGSELTKCSHMDSSDSTQKYITSGLDHSNFTRQVNKDTPQNATNNVTANNGLSQANKITKQSNTNSSDMNNLMTKPDTQLKEVNSNYANASTILKSNDSSNEKIISETNKSAPTPQEHNYTTENVLATGYLLTSQSVAKETQNITTLTETSNKTLMKPAQDYCSVATISIKPGNETEIQQIVIPFESEEQTHKTNCSETKPAVPSNQQTHDPHTNARPEMTRQESGLRSIRLGSNSSSMTRSRRLRQDMTMTLILLSINLVFLATKLPYNVHRMTLPGFPYQENIWSSTDAEVKLHLAILGSYHNALSFLFYCVAGSKFRRELRKMLCELISKFQR